ncbi:MAG TPA: response regulator [Gemmataceae bacterium]|nr:response regulator [Gemmataceae bacterium]
MQGQSLRVLLVEDREEDAIIVLRELTQAGYTLDSTRVDTDEDYRAQIELVPDIILSDYNLPQFSAIDALRILHERAVDIPFIIVSGSIGEEVAVQAMQKGASDYLLKDRLGRLAKAVKQALDQKTLRDQHRRAEQALHDSEELLRNAFEYTNVPMMLSDVSHRFVRVNAAFTRMFGYSQAEALNLTFGDITHPHDVAQSYAERERLVSGEISSFQMEKRYIHKDGHGLWGLVNISLIRDAKGNPVRYVGQVQDITDRKAAAEALQVAETQLRQAQKMEAFGQLAGGIAHDFNNLLTIITGYSELLLSGVVPEDKTPEFVREIRKAGNRAAALTRQLLAFSRKQMLQPVELDLNAVVTDTEKMLRRLIGEDIDLAAALSPDLGKVHADPGQVEQVIINLVVNARDAMPTGGHLTIETANIDLDETYIQNHPGVHPGEYVMLAVTDSGCGMDAKTRSRIFEPFFTTKEVGKGTGLGLATVHGIVKQSGGNIEVYTEVGHGTTFKIYLPRLRGSTSSAKAVPGPLAVPRGNETILLAEDEEAVRSVVQMTLESNGYTVLVAQSGQDALKLCQDFRAPIHLLITDVVMPQMSGRQLADRAVVERPEIKVLYLSGYTDDAIVRHGVLQAGMAFLQKPFTPLILGRKVREVLGNATTWVI